MLNKEPKSIPFAQVTAALLDQATPFSPAYLHRFSDLSKKDFEDLQNIWPQVNENRRASLMEDLEELSDVDPLLNFEVLSKFALTDTDPRVRARAIALLWENSEPQTARTFIKLLSNDPEEIVRAAAASALGIFTYLGELEEISEDLHQTVENAFLKAYKSNDTNLVRRRCLESLGYSSREEVSKLIRESYARNDRDWLISAIFAMGRSADEQWKNSVIKMIDHHDPEVQIEAVRAA
jgi:HEAT repeat protein